MKDSKKETLRQRGWSIQSDGTVEILGQGESSELLNASTLEQSTSHQPQLETSGQPPMNDGTDRSFDKIDKADRKRSRSEAEIPTDDAKRPRVLDYARRRLSKWAARLFDPDRPKGLIELPEIIPLKDTFLSAFGKREKDRDSRHGISLPIESPTDEPGNEDENNDISAAASTVALPEQSNSFFKVKIANLKFTTTEETIRQACQKYGIIHSLDLPKDENNSGLNKGRAVVTFIEEAASLKCIEKLAELDGRRLRVSAALAPAASASTKGGAATARYYTTDISTKCFRCGEVGHYSESCPNERLVKPCVICSESSHDFRDCPNRNVCFNCDVPGHVSRECLLPRGQPQRRVCTICFWSGHTKEQCRSYANRIDVASQALCMICGSYGHFMCRDMQWYFGLNGISCYNCGRTGHSGFQCDRPRLDECSRNEDVGTKEVERAEAWSYAEDEINAMQSKARGRAQQNQDPRMNRDSRRVQSLPPMRRDRRSQR